MELLAIGGEETNEGAGEMMAFMFTSPGSELQYIEGIIDMGSRGRGYGIPLESVATDIASCSTTLVAFWLLDEFGLLCMLCCNNCN
jgi:hypothetical protein